MDKSNSINWFGPINNLGYGVASIGYYSGLNKVYNKVNFIPIGNKDKNIPIKEGLFDHNLPSVGFWHGHEANRIIGNKRVLITTFELDKFDDNVKDQLSKLDAIGTASNWGLEVLRKNLPGKKVFRAPHGTEQYSLSKDNYSTPKNTLRIFSLGKFEKRKSCLELIEALEILSSRNRNISYTLCASWFNPFFPGGYPYAELNSRNYEPQYIADTFKSIYNSSYKKENLIINLLNYPLHKETELQNIMASNDVFISASKAEGWNLGLTEAMSCGVPCIATMNTAHLDYCTDDNCVPIYTHDTEPAVDNMFFNDPSCYWQKVTPEHIVNALTVFKLMSPIEKAKMAKKAKQKVTQFTWEKSAKIIKEIVDGI